MSYEQFKREVFCFLFQQDGEAPNDDKLDRMTQLLSEWQNREYIDIDSEMAEEIRAVRDGKPDDDLKKLLNID